MSPEKLSVSGTARGPSSPRDGARGFFPSGLSETTARSSKTGAGRAVRWPRCTLALALAAGLAMVAAPGMAQDAVPPQCKAADGTGYRSSGQARGKTARILGPGLVKFGETAKFSVEVDPALGVNNEDVVRYGGIPAGLSPWGLPRLDADRDWDLVRGTGAHYIDGDELKELTDGWLEYTLGLTNRGGFDETKIEVTAGATPDDLTKPYYILVYADFYTGGDNPAPPLLDLHLCKAVLVYDDTTTRQVAENTEAGVDIGTPVAATDDDNQALTWSLDDADAALFDIDTANGQLKTKAPLDFEAKPRYEVTVTATDTDSNTGTITVTIEVTDSEEPPGRPDQPQVELEATAGENALMVTWTAPDTSGRPDITDYDVRYRVRGSGASYSDWSHDGPGTTATITGLMGV